MNRYAIKLCSSHLHRACLASQGRIESSVSPDVLSRARNAQTICVSHT